jgi:hypothetical protein
LDWVELQLVTSLEVLLLIHQVLAALAERPWVHACILAFLRRIGQAKRMSERHRLQFIGSAAFLRRRLRGRRRLELLARLGYLAEELSWAKCPKVA